MRIPSQKKAYEKLNERVEKYISMIEMIYSTLNSEIADSISLLDYDGSTPFEFRNYPQTKRMLDDVQMKLVNDIQSVIVNGVTAEWAESNFSQDRVVDRFLRSFGLNPKDEKYKRYFTLNNAALHSFIQRKERGLNLSARVWNLAQNYKDGLEKAVSCAVGSGMSAITLSKRISQYLNDFPQLRSDYSERFGAAADIKDCEYMSARLARTEINMAYRTAEQTRWADLDFVVGYEVKRSGRKYPCKVCESLAGRYPKNFKWQSWHPNCRCYAVPILKTEEEFFKSEDSHSVNEITDVPQNFKNWLLENGERIIESKKRGTLPYFLKFNKYV